jgi:hypothetical protein
MSLPACDQCGYDLTGLLNENRATCPECGTHNSLVRGRVRRHSQSILSYVVVMTWPAPAVGLFWAYYAHVLASEVALYGNPANESEALEPCLLYLVLLLCVWLGGTMIGVAVTAMTKPPGPQRRRAILALLAALPVAAALLFLPSLLVGLFR